MSRARRSPYASRSVRSRNSSLSLAAVLKWSLGVAVLVGVWFGASSITIPSFSGLTDRTGPAISETSPLNGLGPIAREVRYQVKDDGGLQEVVVTLSQGDVTHQVYKQTPNAGVTSHDVAVVVNPTALKLVAGTATLRVVSRDSSVWGNEATVVKELPIDLTRPRIEPLTVQQNGTAGGAELVVFRYLGRPLARGGVQVRGVVFNALPVSAFDSSLANAQSLYVSLFALPYDFNPSTEPLKLVATDDFGNTVEAPFNYRIATKEFSQVEMNLGPEFYNLKIPPLLTLVQQSDPSLPLSGDLQSDFKFVNENLRGMNEAVIRRAISDSPVRERLWRGAFIRPMAAAPKASFAEKRLYKRGQELLSQSLHMGVDLADVEQAPVQAANAGQVVYADELGIYGGLVIIDHGGGVSTLYGHLSAMSVKVGDRVTLGQEIARTGATGLAGGDHLHYEVRVHGAPVSPHAWWDTQWIKEHIEEKVRSAVPTTAASQPS